MSLLSTPFSSVLRRMRSEQGFNLIEAAIVLGIVGLIVGGIWAAASSAYNNMRLQGATSQILVVAQNARNMFSNNPSDTEALTNEQSISLGLVPTNMVTNVSGSNVIRSPWGSQVDVTRGSGDRFITIVYNDLPQASCTGLLTRLAGTGSNSGIRTISGGAAGNVYVADPTVAQDLLVSATETAAACTATTTTNDITVTVFSQ